MPDCYFFLKVHTKCLHFYSRTMFFSRNAFFPFYQENLFCKCSFSSLTPSRAQNFEHDDIFRSFFLPHVSFLDGINLFLRCSPRCSASPRSSISTWWKTWNVIWWLSSRPPFNTFLHHFVNQRQLIMYFVFDRALDTPQFEKPEIEEEFLHLYAKNCRRVSLLGAMKK